MSLLTLISSFFSHLKIVIDSLYCLTMTFSKVKLFQSRFLKWVKKNSEDREMLLSHNLDRRKSNGISDSLLVSARNIYAQALEEKDWEVSLLLDSPHQLKLLQLSLRDLGEGTRVGSCFAQKFRWYHLLVFESLFEYCIKLSKSILVSWDSETQPKSAFTKWLGGKIKMS